MKKTLWALVVLNIMLLTLVFWKFGGENAAFAQRAPRGDYVMIPGRRQWGGLHLRYA